MSILNHRRRRIEAHPPWCDTTRCQSAYARLGEHRSAPLTVGPLVLTLSIRRGDASPRLETRTVTRLRPVATDPADTPGVSHAAALTRQVLTAIKLARVDHSGHTGTSTPGEV